MEKSCPHHKSGECYIHTQSLEIYGGIDGYTQNEKIVIANDLSISIDHKEFRIRERCRELSFTANYYCEIHDYEWKESSNFHKGKTYLNTVGK